MNFDDIQARIARLNGHVFDDVGIRGANRARIDCEISASRDLPHSVQVLSDSIIGGPNGD